jgi:hypothetical protein
MFAYSNRTILSCPRLPSVDADVSVSKRIRYNEVTAGTTQISRADLLNLIVLPSSTTQAYGLLKSCRIKAIEVWTLESSASTPLGNGGEFLLTWLSNLGDEVTKRCTQMGMAPGYLLTSPPRNSLAGFWTTAASDLTEIICEISALDGSIIDIIYEFKFCNNNASRSFTITSGLVGKVSFNNFGSFTVQGYQNYTPV